VNVVVDDSTEAPARPTAGRREFMALIVVMMAMGAISIDLMLPGFGDIRAEYGMASDSPRVSWIITAFFLGMAVGPLVFGPASDRFGRRAPLRAGLVVYVAAAIGATLVPSFGWVVALRFLWGIGAAAPRSLCIAMVRDRYEGDAMARSMSLIMAVFLLVPIFAPTVGAALLTVLPWRALFWVPATAATGLLVWSTRLPETLPPERRRPFTFRAFGEAARVVVTNRQTMSFTIAVTFLFGIMTAYLSNSELIIDEVYDRAGWFPAYFGIVGVLLALSSLNNARLVQRLGTMRLIRRLAVIGIVLSTGLLAVCFVGGGHPAFALFAVSLAITVPVAQGLVPNCNTAAMLPVPHVAGTASALMASITTAGGAVLGGVVTGAYDGTTRPFGVGMVVCFVGAAAMIAVALSAAARTSDVPAT
jgi:DHA1 family bicyclomycin/chloramphenicol resistance-like MFS transporter